MPGMRTHVLLLVLSLFLVATASPPYTANATDDPPHRRAELRGSDLSLHEVSRYHCHDGRHPVIRCFTTAAERDLDAWAETPTALGGTESVGPDAIAMRSAVYYVTFYEHASYGGSSFTTSQAISDLTETGWNDAISSFKSLNGQRPKWWEHAGYAGASWQWAAGAWVANVGSGANDVFSSLKNVP